MKQHYNPNSSINRSSRNICYLSFLYTRHYVGNYQSKDEYVDPCSHPLSHWDVNTKIHSRLYNNTY